jgi:hypothetical protein
VAWFLTLPPSLRSFFTIDAGVFSAAHFVAYWRVASLVDGRGSVDIGAKPTQRSAPETAFLTPKRTSVGQPRPKGGLKPPDLDADSI